LVSITTRFGRSGSSAFVGKQGLKNFGGHARSLRESRRPAEGGLQSIGVKGPHRFVILRAYQYSDDAVVAHDPHRFALGVIKEFPESSFCFVGRDGPHWCSCLVGLNPIVPIFVRIVRIVRIVRAIPIVRIMCRVGRWLGPPRLKPALGVRYELRRVSAGS
jgi:hypothetical protein